MQEIGNPLKVWEQVQLLHYAEAQQPWEMLREDRDKRWEDMLEEDCSDEKDDGDLE